MKRTPFLSGTIWPIHPQPHVDELLSSWMVRIARAHGVHPYSFWHKLASVGQFRTLDERVPPAVSEVLVRGTGIKPPQIRAMTLASFAEFGLLRIANRPVIAFCPECLKEPIPFYRRAWCLAFVTICGVHRVELQRGCAACGALIRFEHVPVNQLLATCHNCAYDLTAAAASTYEPSSQLMTVLLHQNQLAHLNQLSCDQSQVACFEFAAGL